MKRFLFDVNVVLDVLLDREPHVESSAAAWFSVETGMAEGLLSAHTVTTIYYFVRKERGATQAKDILSTLLRVFRVAAVNASVIDDALRSSLTDFEDAVTAAAARLADCDYILTRDPKGFRGSLVRPLAPEAALPILRQQ